MLPPFSSVLSFFSSFIPGLRLIDGGDLQQLSSLLFRTTTGITALAGGASAAASPVLNVGMNEISVCATNSDSVVLPYAVPGMAISVWNDTANTLKVFSQTSNPNNGNAADLIAPSGTNVGAASQTVATAVVADFICFKAGVWKMMISA